MSFKPSFGEFQNNPNLQWLIQVVRLNSIAAAKLAVGLLVMSDSNQGKESFSITPTLLRQHKISRTNCHRALQLLEAAGLVSVKRQRGISPVARILDVDARPELNFLDEEDYENGEFNDS
jgi:hypothetical protein